MNGKPEMTSLDDDGRGSLQPVQCSDDVRRRDTVDDATSSRDNTAPAETVEDITIPKEPWQSPEHEITEPCCYSGEAEERMLEEPARTENKALGSHGEGVESRVSGVSAAQHPPQGNQRPVNIGKATNVTIIHNYMAVGDIKDGKQTRRKEPMQGTDHHTDAQTVNTMDDANHSDTLPEVEEMMKALDQDGRVLLCALPGARRDSLLSALEQEHRKRGYGVHYRIGVEDIRREELPDGSCLLIIINAFGNVRFDNTQYQRFFKARMYSVSRPATAHIVFLLYPHIFRELQQHDTATPQNAFRNMTVLHVEQDSSVSDYVKFLVHMLRDSSHGQTLAALLVLTMKGCSCFADGKGQVEELLRNIGFTSFSQSLLKEYASLLVDCVLAHNGKEFITRDVYNAAARAVAMVYLDTTTLQACDVQFLAQYVRTGHTPAMDNSLVLRHQDDVLLLMERMCEAMVTGQLPEVSQHPCLQSQQFLQEFQDYCEQNDRLRAVLTAVDPQHGLPLLYWSVWSLTCVFPEWCLDLTMRQHTDSGVLHDHLLCAAVVAALLENTTDTDLSRLVDRFRDEIFQTTEMTTAMKLSPPLPRKGERFTEQLKSVCNSIASCQVTTFPLCSPGTPSLPIPKELLTVELAKDVIHVEWPYMLLRLLTDREVDEEDSEGNTLLHVAGDTGQLQVVQMLVHSGASLLAKNKAGLTPPQLAARRREERTTSSDPSLRRFHAACRDGDMATVKSLLCHNVTVDDQDSDGMTALHHASLCGQTEIASLLIDLGADVNTQCEDGRTALHIASRQGHTGNVRLLLGGNAAVNTKDGQGRTPLYTACEKGQTETVRALLLHKGTDVRAVTADAWSPLYMACWEGLTQIAELLVQHGADVSVTGPGVASALHSACYRGHSDIVKVLLQHGADVDIISRRGETPLHKACDRGHTDTVTLLLQHGADVNSAASDGRTPLHQACERGHIDIVTLLLQHGADVNVTTSDGVTPVRESCDRGRTDIVTLLLQNGADVNITTSDGLTALCRACDRGDAGIVTLLLQNGADVNTTTSDGRTALHNACYGSYTDIVTLLLQYGADVNVTTTSDALTPLHLSTERGDTDIVTLLLQHGADVNINASDGKTAMHLACGCGDADIVTLLLQHGADVNVTTSEGETPLCRACCRGDMYIVTLLFQHGADVNITTPDGVSPLHWACFRGYTDIATLLLQHGADANVATSDGVTPLHWACYRGYVDIVTLFLQHGADVTIRTKKGNTVLDDARSEGHAEIVALLKKHPSHAHREACCPAAAAVARILGRRRGRQP